MLSRVSGEVGFGLNLLVIPHTENVYPELAINACLKVEEYPKDFSTGFAVGYAGFCILWQNTSCAVPQTLILKQAKTGKSA